MDAVTIVWDSSEELLQVLYLQFVEGAAPKIFVTLDDCHCICYHYNRLVRWWQSVHFPSELPRDVLIADK